mmetsp:Transcript_88161/g.139370  ORF Transcript_88161/g.139370 Transcript_88161/m.139370 type:complete len:501 (+) Transcript_88161:65-1567(+)
MMSCAFSSRLVLIRVWAWWFSFTSSEENFEVYFEETFTDIGWKDRWIHSKWKGLNGPRADFDWSRGPWYADQVESLGLRTMIDHTYNVISAKFPPFSNRGEHLVVQYSIRQFMTEYGFCGGGYIKVLPHDFDQEWFQDDTPYLIMFGPDVCGYDPAHTLLTFKAPHENVPLRKKLKTMIFDHEKFTRFYTLHVRPDDTYTLYLDFKPMIEGHMRNTHNFPSETMDDPKDKKPRKWDDREKIPHPKHKNKPEDWHDEKLISDPESKMPAAWDEQEDGPWRPAKIKNPQYKGVWKARKVKNPAFKGKWIPKQLPHPHYREQVHAHDEIGGIGFEIWTPHNGTIFDNILVCMGEGCMDYANRIYTKWIPFQHYENETVLKYYAHKDDATKEAHYGLWDLAEEEEEVEEEDDDSEHDEDEEEEMTRPGDLLTPMGGKLHNDDAQEGKPEEGASRLGATAQRPMQPPPNSGGLGRKDIPKGMEQMYAGLDSTGDDDNDPYRAHEL